MISISKLGYVVFETSTEPRSVATSSKSPNSTSQGILCRMDCSSLDTIRDRNVFKRSNLSGAASAELARARTIE